MLLYRERDDKASQGGVRTHAHEALMVPTHFQVALDDALHAPKPWMVPTHVHKALEKLRAHVHKAQR